MNVFVYTCALSGELHFVKERPCTPPLPRKGSSPSSLSLRSISALAAVGGSNKRTEASSRLVVRAWVGSSKRGGARSMGCPKGEAPYMAYLDYIAM
eukprot:scaffold431_cov334-Pavlova_lutheri.AAC.50